MSNQYTHGWTTEEREWLKNNYPYLTREEILKWCEKHNRSYKAVINQASYLGIKKDKQHLKNLKGGDKMGKVLIDLEEFVNTLLEKFKDKPPKVRIPKAKQSTGKLKEDAILVLSDIHVGKKNVFVDLRTGKAVETYNKKIMWKEAGRLIESIQMINDLLNKSYKLETLHIFLLGDIVDNDIIFSGQRFYIESGAGAQVIEAVKLLSFLIKEFLKMFKKINIIVIGGNHGRLSGNSRTAHPWYNNLDWLIGQMLQISFKNVDRVKIETPESWFFIKQINGWKYLLHHGAGIPAWMGFPYYGISRRALARKAEMDIDVEIIGHFHRIFEIPVSSKSITLVNGCWIEKDERSWQKYGYLTSPCQLYFGTSVKRPLTWKFVLELNKRTPHKRRE